jgi:pyruvate ferredoxin oxidoreductase gamma subunit
MTLVRWHGRGGQGAFTAAKLLGAAYSSGSQKYALSFPSFGPERRGAPVRAFTKLDNKPILNRSESKKCDYIVILDDTLYDPSFLEELTPNGKVLVNSNHDYNDSRILSIDALTIATEELNAPITNTAMLGALLGVWNELSEEQIINAVEDYLPEKIVDRNKSVIIRSAAAAKQKENQI